MKDKISSPKAGKKIFLGRETIFASARAKIENWELKIEN